MISTSSTFQRIMLVLLPIYKRIRRRVYKYTPTGKHIHTYIHIYNMRRMYTHIQTHTHTHTVLFVDRERDRERQREIAHNKNTSKMKLLNLHPSFSVGESTIYIVILVIWCCLNGFSRLSLAIRLYRPSLPVGLLDFIQCPYRTVGDKF